VSVTSTFTGAYQKADAFGLPGNGGAIAGVTTRQPFTISNIWHGVLGGWDELPEGLGGWSLNVHNVYDVTGRMLRLGDGSNRTLAHIPPVIQSAAGNGSVTLSGDGGAATSAGVPTPTSVAIGGDGTLYISDGQSCVRKVSPGGIIGPFAGQCGNPGFSGDNAAATSAQLRAPSGIAVAPDGTLYIADTLNQRVRRVFPSGVIQTVAGSGPTGSASGGFSGDGGNALQATFNSPSGVDVGANGVLYIADTLNGRIRSVSPDGTVRTVAGTAGSTTSGNEGQATAASLASPTRVRVGADGSLFITEPPGQVVRRIGHDGVIHGFAGFASSTIAGYSGDGSQAKGALLSSPTDIAIGSEGTVYIIDQNNTVRSVAPSGIIGTFAGVAGKTGFSGDGGLAAAATFSASQGIAVAPDGTIYVANTADNRVRRIGAALIGFTGNTSTFQFATADGRRLDTFDGQGRHLATTDALTSATLIQFGYDSNNRLATVTDVDQNVTHINHDTSGNPINIKAPFGQTTTFGLDDHGYLKTVTDAANNVTSFTYDSTGLMQTKTDANLKLSQYHYDALGRLHLDQDAALGSITVGHTDTPTGSSVSLTTALNHATTYQTKSTPDGSFSRQNTSPDTFSNSLQFSPNGATKTTAPDGTVVTSTPIPDPQFGMLAPTMDVTTTLPSFNTQHRKVSRSVVRSGGAVTQVIETTNLNGNTWTRTFDGASRTWTDSSPLARTTTTVVDAAGRPTSVTVSGITPRTAFFNSFGQLKNIDQGNRDEAFTYYSTADAQNGYLQQLTDPLLEHTSYTRDAFGRELTETDPFNYVTGLGWDPVGNFASVTPPGQPIHNLSYSPVNLLGQYTPPALASVPNPQTKYVYDLDRSLSTVTRPDGAQLIYAPDTAGRLYTITTPTTVVTRLYSPSDGKLSSISTSGDNISIAFGYDGPLSTRSEYSGAVAGLVVRQYNSDFRPFRELVSGTGTADGYFGYDLDGLTTCVSPTSCTTVGADAFTLLHDPSNGRVTSTALRTVAHTLGYNAFGELATESAVSGSTTLYSETYDNNTTRPRDQLGRITLKTETLQGTETDFVYSYWPTGQLKIVNQLGGRAIAYRYDKNGNRISAVIAGGGGTLGTYDAQDRLITYGTLTYTYTANGELQTKTNSAGGGVTHYTYDLFGNLKRVDLPNGDFVEYLVDGLNRRVAKKKNGTFVKKWLYRDQLHPVEELDGAGNFVSRFMYASGKNSPDYMVQGSGSTSTEYRILSDQLGSPRLVVNSATGAVVQRMREDEFGIVLEDTNPGFTPFGFAGGLYDPDTGLVRFGARDYDPFVGRWISKDPILFGGRQANLYVYVNDDPVNRSDAAGLWGIFGGGGGEAAIGPAGSIGGGYFWGFGGSGSGSYFDAHPGISFPPFASAGAECGFFTGDLGQFNKADNLFLTVGEGFGVQVNLYLGNSGGWGISLGGGVGGGSPIAGGVFFH
jgi:RHS repeat-associated protein